MKSNNPYRYRASSSSIKLNIISCSKPPSPKHTQNPRAWMRNNKRKKQIKVVALLAILKNYIGQEQKKKRSKNQGYIRQQQQNFDWIEIAEAGYNIGIIFKCLLGRIQKKLSRASSVNGQFLLAKKHSQRLHISRLALATQLMMPTGQKDRQFKQMRHQTLKMSKLYCQDKTLSIKNIYSCISGKVYSLLSQNSNLQILSRDKVSLSHLRLAGEGFRSIVVFFNKHLNSVMIKFKFEQPEWQIFEIVGNYDKEYRNNVLIADEDIPSFFYDGFKLSIELSDRFFHYPVYQKSVDETGFKEFLEITISLRYDLCYLERILQKNKIEKQNYEKKQAVRGNTKTKTISIFKTKYTFTPKASQNKHTRSLWVKDPFNKHIGSRENSKSKSKKDPRQEQKQNFTETVGKAMYKPQQISRKAAGRFIYSSQG